MREAEKSFDDALEIAHQYVHISSHHQETQRMMNCFVLVESKQLVKHGKVQVSYFQIDKILHKCYLLDT